MTDFIYRVTIVCPEALIADANHFAALLGGAGAAFDTFRAPTHEDASGNLYAVASAVVREGFLNAAEGALTDPGIPGFDLAAAQRAQAATALFVGGGEVTVPPQPGVLWAYVEPAPGAPRSVLENQGVTRLPAPE